MRPGTGAYPLRGHNNVQGASDNGSMPNNFPGYQPVSDPAIRARFESFWNVKLPAAKGFDNHEMIDAIHQGKLKSMYLIGEDIALVDSNANYVAEALSKLDDMRRAEGAHLITELNKRLTKIEEEADEVRVLHRLAALDVLAVGAREITRDGVILEVDHRLLLIGGCWIGGLGRRPRPAGGQDRGC